MFTWRPRAIVRGGDQVRPASKVRVKRMRSSWLQTRYARPGRLGSAVTVSLSLKRPPPDPATTAGDSHDAPPSRETDTATAVVSPVRLVTRPGSGARDALPSRPIETPGAPLRPPGPRPALNPRTPRGR